MQSPDFVSSHTHENNQVNNEYQVHIVIILQSYNGDLAALKLLKGATLAVSYDTPPMDSEDTIFQYCTIVA